MLAATAATCTLGLMIASASAMPHRALFGYTRDYVTTDFYHHINTTITPPRCGQTKVKGNAAFVKATINAMAGTFPISNGTCASAGFTQSLGQQDLTTDKHGDASKQTFNSKGVIAPNTRRSKGRYTYVIHFYGKPGDKVGTPKFNPLTATVVGLAVATPALSTLVAALKAGGLVGTLSGTASGPFTVFAPTNAAFAALGSAVPALLLPQNKALLVKVLEYHVIAGKTIQASQITDGLEAKTLEGQTLAFGVSAGHVYVGVYGVDAEVTQANIAGTNGIVHVINKVLLFPGFKLPKAAAPAGGKGKGKGAACTSDATFSDSYGTCAAYSNNQWCANGATGSGWQSGWGGLSAAVQKACCACRGGASTPAAPAANIAGTIVGLAIATPTLSTLVAAVKAAGLVATLSSPGPFTVFAPTNAAFAKLGDTVTQLLLPENKAKLVQVLTYHVLAGKVLSGAITNDQSVATVEGQKMCFDVNTRMSPHGVSIYECGTTTTAAEVTKANIIASNGVIHVIDTVLIPPGFSLEGQ